MSVTFAGSDPRSSSSTITWAACEAWALSAPRRFRCTITTDGRTSAAASTAALANTLARLTAAVAHVCSTTWLKSKAATSMSKRAERNNSVQQQYTRNDLSFYLVFANSLIRFILLPSPTCAYLTSIYLWIWFCWQTHNPLVPCSTHGRPTR